MASERLTAANQALEEIMDGGHTTYDIGKFAMAMHGVEYTPLDTRLSKEHPLTRSPIANAAIGASL